MNVSHFQLSVITLLFFVTLGTAYGQLPEPPTLDSTTSGSPSMKVLWNDTKDWVKEMVGYAILGIIFLTIALIGIIGYRLYKLKKQNRESRWNE